jgi:hypothetical protein
MSAGSGSAGKSLSSGNALSACGIDNYDDLAWA